MDLPGAARDPQRVIARMAAPSVLKRPAAFDLKGTMAPLTVLRLRSRMGRLQGVARVNGRPVIEGTMTFALGPPQGEV